MTDLLRHTAQGARRIDSRGSVPDDVARSVLDVALEILAELDLDTVLGRVAEAARGLAGSRYAALGVLDTERTRLERFITVGVDAETRARIGPLPTGRGVLGELIDHPGPLRMREVGAHPRSYGFPAGHPPMDSFLGVPVLVGGEPFGFLYLTGKEGAEEFSAADEQTIELLAELAGVAIDHARRYTGLRASRETLQQTVEALEATMQIAHALGGETDLATILELVAKRGRALVSARALIIEYLDGRRLEVAATAGELPATLVGEHVDLEDSLAGVAMRTRETLRIEDEPNRARFEHHGLGRLGVRAEAGLVVPLVFRRRSHGVLIAVDRLGEQPAFDAADQRLLESFAASAATAIATAETFAAERRRQRLAAAEQERARWARELHDETLQGLAAIKLVLTAASRAGDRAAMESVVSEAAAYVDREIVGLRALIADLRPATLEELGLAAAVEDLADRTRRQGIEVAVDLDLAFESGQAAERLTDELEIALYRIVQEALTNAARHGGAGRVEVSIAERVGSIRAVVADDGSGFSPTERSSGFGIIGMRERAELLGGELDVRSVPGSGTEIVAELPLARRSERAA